MKKVPTHLDTALAEQVRREYLQWCLELLEIHRTARKGFQEFIETHDLQFFDKPRYRQKGQIPYHEVQILAELKGISVTDARKLRDEFNEWIGAIQWSDPEKTTQRLAKFGSSQSLN